MFHLPGHVSIDGHFFGGFEPFAVFTDAELGVRRIRREVRIGDFFEPEIRESYRNGFGEIRPFEFDGHA